MATFKVRFRLNPGRSGIALGKHAKQSEAIESFLRSMARDLDQNADADMWLASKFKNASVIFDAEYQAVVEADAQLDFHAGIKALVKSFKDGHGATIPDFVSDRTVESFADLRSSLERDETIGIGIFDAQGKTPKFHYIDKLQLEKIADSVETHIYYYGTVIGSTYEWNKGAEKPYILIREINTGDLVKCQYQDKDYKKVASLFSDKNATVIIDGHIAYAKSTEKYEVRSAEKFTIAPDFSDKDLQDFIGCAPGMSGDLSAADYIKKNRLHD